MELSKVRGRWVIAFAALAAIGFATAWQPAVAQDKPAAQEKPAQKADEPAALPEAEKVMKDQQPAQEGSPKTDGKPKSIPLPGKKTGIRPTDAQAKARAKQNDPTPTVQLKPGEVPGIKFDTPVYDFGRVKAGTEIEHDFWFTNTGTGPLEIVKAKPS